MAISQIFTGQFTYSESPDRVIRSLSGQDFKAGGLSTADSNVRKVTIRAVQTIDFFGQQMLPSVTFPLAPNDVSFSDLADRYEELDRPGREPLVYRSSPRNPKLELRLLLTANTNKGTDSAEFYLAWLKLVSRVDIDLIVVGMGLMSASARYRITELTASAVRMNPNQEITAAEVNISLIEVPQAVQGRATVPGTTTVKDVPAPTGGYTSTQGRTEAAPTYGRTSTATTTWSALRELV